ncbi:MAG: GTPase Era [Oscillospiraceae bacterium]|nr:GTPase Era [Oscillospiraceae bacterium]
MTSKAAMITIAGRPNVGKSTLTNALTGEKVAIVTPKPQTTRNRICGVFTRGSTQIVLMDTPGFHKARTRLGDYMVDVVKQSVADVDAVVLVVEPIDNIGEQEDLLISHISGAGVPAVLAINKIDTVNVGQALPVIDRYSKRYDFDAIIPLSARTGDGIPQLLERFELYAREGPHLFPEDMVTDQPEKQIIAEIIREKLLICLDKEIPHGTAVEITKFSERGDGDQPVGGDGDQPPIIDLDATIYCEKQSHKGIIIGKNGAMLKRIGQMARMDIERFMGAAVFLQTWVKVKENWRDSKTMIRNFGYSNQ